MKKYMSVFLASIAFLLGINSVAATYAECRSGCVKQYNDASIECNKLETFTEKADCMKKVSPVWEACMTTCAASQPQ